MLAGGRRWRPVPSLRVLLFALAPVVNPTMSSISTPSAELKREFTFRSTFSLASPDRNCADLSQTDFTVKTEEGDPHGFDRDRDGRGCELENR